MGRGVAESWAELGHYQHAEEAFAELVEQFPENPWSYIAWGDFYHFRRQNVVRSRELYSKAVELASEQGDEMAVQERLEMLNRGV